MIGRLSSPTLKFVQGLILMGLLFWIFIPTSAEAIPAFARKYDLSCGSCHTKPPRLNSFGEAFHMAGFHIPATNEGEIRKKRQIGRVWSETDFLNIFSMRVVGNFVEAASNPSDLNLSSPQEVELYLAGTLTQEISFFFTLGGETREIDGMGSTFKQESRFGLGREFFLMVNLQALLSEGSHGVHGTGSMRHGPMIMVGKIDPSTIFSYSTNRQILGSATGRVASDAIQRLTLSPYAFAAKFSGIRTGNGDVIEATRGVLYNTEGDFGLDLHAMIGRWTFQTGLMQGLEAGATDVNAKKDPYLMVRRDFGEARYYSGSLSGLIYQGNDTARVDNTLIDWLRYGWAANIKYRYLDIYGAMIWDRLKDLPPAVLGTFDDTAFGATVEADYLFTDRWLLSLRYDQMNTGGESSQKANGAVLSAQAKFYPRENIAFYLRESLNVGKDHVVQNFRTLTVLGVDLDF